MQPFLTIVESDQDALHLVIRTGRGEVTVMANQQISGTTLELSRVHVEGVGLSPAIIRKAARFLGAQAGVRAVVVRGGIRTDGARPGHLPAPFQIEVR